MGEHYVPQKYLRGFALRDQPSMIWQFDKSNGEFLETPLSIRKVAQKKSFYGDNWEKRLALEIEKPANKVLLKILDGNLYITPAERLVLARYIASMLKRVPNHRINN